MFTIDLLKGQGLPIKSGVTTVTIIGAGFGVPAVLLMLMIGSYFHSKVIIKTQSRVLRNYETGFANLKAGLERQRVQEVQCLKFASCSPRIETSMPQAARRPSAEARLSES